MVTTLDKILMYAANVRLRIDSVNYLADEFGLAEIECTALGKESDDAMFNLTIPIPINKVSALLESVEQENKVAPVLPGNRRLRTTPGGSK